MTRHDYTSHPFRSQRADAIYTLATIGVLALIGCVLGVILADHIVFWLERSTQVLP